MDSKEDIANSKNLILHIKGMKYKLEPDTENYSEEDYEAIQEIIDILGGDIWIDRSYINYKGNIHKDAFIVEDAWYEFLDDIVRPKILGKKLSKYNSQVFDETMMTISIMYLMGEIDKYGYDIEHLQIMTKMDRGTKVEFLKDTRTNWDM